MKGVIDATQLERVLRRLTQDGWVFPIHYSAISNNGSMAMGRYWKSQAEMIASHCPSGQFVLPINMMLVDERGQAALIKWLPDAEPLIVQ